MIEKQDNMDVETRLSGGAIVITPLVNEITHNNNRGFLNAVKDSLIDHSGDVVIDMSNIQIIDSVSLGSLVAALKYVRSRGGEMFIAGAAPAILQLFDMLNFRSIFKIYDNVENIP